MKKVITFGEVMQRLSPQEFKRFRQASTFEVVYGGGEANVAVSLAGFGVPAAHVTIFPDNDLGYAATDYLKGAGVDTQHILYGGNRMGLYFLEKGASIRASKVIYDRANSSFAEMNHQLLNWHKIFECATWFHWTGITPAISLESYLACQEAVRVAKEMGITVSGDITYRKNLWQYGKTVQEVMPHLVDNCDVIMCGVSEAAEIFNIDEGNLNEDSFQNVAMKLQEQFPNLKAVISTKRETINASSNSLSGVIFSKDKIFESEKYLINPIIDRIGGGDAFMGGYIYGTLQQWGMQKVIDFATAASVWKHSIHGDANCASVEEIDQVAKGESVGRLIR